jgi:hypothetical protein
VTDVTISHKELVRSIYTYYGTGNKKWIEEATLMTTILRLSWKIIAQHNYYKIVSQFVAVLMQNAGSVGSDQQLKFTL